MAYSTILLDGLESDNANMKVTESEGSWIGQFLIKFCDICAKECNRLFSRNLILFSRIPELLFVVLCNLI